MNPSLLLITHAGLGDALRDTAEDIIGHCPMPVDQLAPQPDEPIETLRERAEATLSSLDRGQGVLILTDAYGATPGNIAVALGEAHGHPVVTGVNLPMLLRVMNYAHLPVAGLVDKALSAARDGILVADGHGRDLGRQHG